MREWTNLPRRPLLLIVTAAAFLLSLEGPAEAQTRRSTERKTRTGASAQEQEFKSKLLGSTGQASAESRSSLSTGLADLSSGRYSSARVDSLAGELATGLRGAKLDGEQADRVSSSFRAILQGGSNHNDVASARAEIERSLSEAGVGQAQRSRIQQELDTLVADPAEVTAPQQRSASETPRMSGQRQRRAAQTPRTSPQQQRNVQKLVGDLAAIRSGSAITPAQTQKLAQDLMTMAAGASRPSQQSVDALAKDLASALADGKLTRKEQMELAQALGNVLTSANISYEEFTAVAQEIGEILEASGATPNGLATIKADLEAIYAELRIKKP